MYNFAPLSDRSDFNFAYWQNGFTAEEVDKIVEYGDKLDLRCGTTGQTIDPLQQDKSVRDSMVGWIKHNDNTAWMWDRLAWVARKLNNQFFGYDLTGFTEDFQYTVYYGSKNQHYDWHMDRGATFTNGNIPRKLSFVMQLSDPNNYDGGNLEFREGITETQAIRERGIIYAFPSWLLHRVTPVTGGTRKSLVIWSGGPAFR